MQAISLPFLIFGQFIILSKMTGSGSCEKYSFITLIVKLISFPFFIFEQLISLSNVLEYSLNNLIEPKKL